MKKLLAILGMITCMIGLSACGQQETTDLPLSEEDLINACVNMLTNLDNVVAQGAVEGYADIPVVYDALLSWQSARQELGTFNGAEGGTVSVNGDETIIELNILGSDHNAVGEFIIDSVTTEWISISVNVTYPFGELMSKAALNTLIGMGTVFVVLIFISLIISCFGLINKTDVKKQDKVQTASVQSAAAADPVVEQIAEKEELAGDAELVAVIAAAIAAYEGSGSTDGFVVRSIRKSSKSKWQNA